MTPAQMEKLNVGESVWEVQTINGPPTLVRWYVVSKNSRLLYLGRERRDVKGLPVSLRQANFYERTPLEAAAAKLDRAEQRCMELNGELGRAKSHKVACLDFFNEIKDNAGNMEEANAASIRRSDTGRA